MIRFLAANDEWSTLSLPVISLFSYFAVIIIAFDVMRLLRVWWLVLTAKNVILAGVKAVTLHDTGNVELWDLSAQFYLTQSDVGKNRALACLDKLKELNVAVDVSTHVTELTTDFLANFQVCTQSYAYFGSVEG